MKQKKMRGISSKVKTEKRVSVNFTAMEFAEFLSMKETAGVQSQSAFIKARVFDKTFRVIKVDRSLLDYYQKLTTLYGQFRSVGVNYNQVVVALKSNFTEKKGSIGQIAGYYFHVVVLWVKLQATVLGVCWAIFLSL